ncbi:hypothetical protein B484DRAFT_362287, partial [Ochromonadaceae sp. CCMP2298]
MYTDGSITWTPAPITLVPNVFPRSSFEYACDMQPILNKLVDRIARDRAFLLDQLSTVSESDDFTKSLVELYKTVPEARLREGLQCGILRSDYMINRDTRPLQVEINTIASSFGFLSKRVSLFHQHLLQRNAGRPELGALLQETFAGTVAGSAGSVVAENVQHNPSDVQLAAALAMAHEEFGRTHGAGAGAGAVVLFIVQPGERNVADQRAFEAQLWALGVPVEFVTLKDIALRGRLAAGTGVGVGTGTGTGAGTGSVGGMGGTGTGGVGGAGDRVLMMRPLQEGAEVPVSVAYFRAGYGPGDYPSSAEWEARSLMEQSNAVLCPNVGYQLAGTKAVQAALCLPGVLERFLTSQESAQLRRCFADQFSLADASVAAQAAAAVESAIVDGAPWVLKPQREGGGNNLYGEELSAFLRENRGQSLLKGYVLMQRIFPQPQRSAFLRVGRLEVLPSISELGVYGTYLAYGKQGAGVGEGAEGAGEGAGEGVLLNAYAGYLLRTKPDGVDEGGVASGYSVL